MDEMRIVEVDERDSSWEQDRPRFRVYLQTVSGSAIGGATATYDVIGADIVQVIDWAQRAAGSSLVYSIALVCDDRQPEGTSPGRGRGLVWLVGMDGNQDELDSVEADVRRRMLARCADPVVVPAADRPPLDPPAAFGTIACGLCRVHEARWVHPLVADRAGFRKHGKGHIWGSPLRVCDRCDRLLRERDVEGLVAVHSGAADRTGPDLGELVRGGIHALLVADLGGQDIARERPVGYAALVAEGFTPLENITGALHLAQAWPAEHRRALPATDPDDASWLPDGQHWFIRSPWASIPLAPLFDLVLRTLDAAFDRDRPPFDDETAHAVVRDLLSRSEPEITALLAEPHPPD